MGQIRARVFNMDKPSKDQFLGARITTAGMEKIDELRGSWSRSEWVRQALRRAAEAKMSGPR